MNRRNITTTFMVLGAGLLLFGGVALAREVQTRDDRNNPVIATPTAEATDDTAGATASPEIGDDHGGNGADDTASPSASPDDHGGNGTDDAAEPTAKATAKPAAAPTAKPTAKPTVAPTAKATAEPTATASPDDHGGNGGDDSPDPTSSPDDHGGHGGDDN
jgi:hypothetical protein